MENAQLLREDGCTSHLNIVLLGGRNSGKSSVGNIILGREEFATKERTTCSKRKGAVAGRWVTVVDTPGWWCDFGALDTAELVKREMINSVGLCFPGPHVFLLVVKSCSFFSSKRLKALEEHIALLGDRVWRHCIIIFTCVDGRKHGMFEERLEIDNSALKRLLNKCSQRCHRFILTYDTVSAQVTQLLVKIQKLVTENAKGHFEMESSFLHMHYEKQKVQEERALQRFIKMKEQRAFLQEQSCHLSDIRIVLVGAKGSGKTSVVNTIIGREGYRGGTGRTAQCDVNKANVSGRHITVVDTPGWWMNYFAMESAAFDRRELVHSLCLSLPGPHVLLLVVRVDRAFTEDYRRAVQEHLESISPQVWLHVIVVFSFGDWLGDTTIERYVESEGEPLRWLVDKCGNRYHVLNNKTMGDGFQVGDLVGKIEEMIAANGSCHHEARTDVIKRLEERRTTEKKRARERLFRKMKQRQALRCQLDKLNCVPEFRLVLLGGRNTGKSSSGNTILGQVYFDTERHTTGYVESRANVKGKTVSVLDTPGGLSGNHDYLMAPSAASRTALLLVVNVSSSFTSSLWEVLQEQMESLGGEQAWSRAMVLFSFGDWMGNTGVEERVESEGVPLLSLVERCGNRYHVLDNKRRGDRSQVYELVDLIDEMLVGARLAFLQRGDPIGTDVTLAHQVQRDTPICRQSHDVRKLTCTDNPQQALDFPTDPGMCCQVVALPDRTRSSLNATGLSNITSSTASGVNSNKVLRWTLGDIKTAMMILPSWSAVGSPHSHIEATGQRSSVFSSRHRASVLALPTVQQSVLSSGADDVIDVHYHLQTTHRDGALKKRSKTEGLRDLIDRWGSTNLEELEAFIDSHFEMVWEQAMSSPQADDGATEQGAAAVEESDQGTVAWINAKLSKLDVLEGIQRELTELRQSLEKCWRNVQALIETNKGQQQQGEEFEYAP